MRCAAATTALRTPIGDRSGIVGLVIQLARDLQLACEDNSELRAALAAQQPWLDLTTEHGPLSKLLAQQQGSLAGGKPNTASLQVRPAAAPAWLLLVVRARRRGRGGRGGSPAARSGFMSV